MKLHAWPPAVIITTERGMNDDTGARAIGPVVLVRGKYVERGDEGILAHELVHVEQFYEAWAAAAAVFLALGVALFIDDVLPWMWHIGILSTLAHPLAYASIRAYRLDSEVMAYRAQIELPDGKGGRLPISTAARYIAESYNLDITTEQAAELLV